MDKVIPFKWALYKPIYFIVSWFIMDGHWEVSLKISALHHM